MALTQQTCPVCAVKLCIIQVATLMLSSVEARFFISGPLPEKLRTWFEQGMLAEVDKKTRTDHYLFLPFITARWDRQESFVSSS